MLHSVIPAALAACVVAQATSSPPDTAGDELMRQFLADDTARITAAGAVERVQSATALEAERKRLRQEYFSMLGLWPLPPRTPLEAKTTGTLERDGFRVENLHFQSRPGLYVTANLYLPSKVEGKLPAVLYLCGHSGRGRDGNKTAFQHHGTWFATHGYACLIVDTLQLGEIAGIHHGTYRYNRWWWQARGYTPAGVECWNAIRALDYLESRPEVDGSRIAATGISGGGAATFWVTAADPRIKVAVPVSGMGDLETYVTDRVIDGHCDCMLLINTHRWEWTTIAALAAPRPLLFANSDHDTIFPMSGNDRIATRLKRLYTACGRPESFDVFVTAGGHDDKLPLRLAAYRWMNRWLKGDSSEVTEPTLAPFKGEELRAFPGDFPADAINDRVDEIFAPVAAPKLPAGAAEFMPWKEDLLLQLRERSFAAPPPEPLGPFETPKLTKNQRGLAIHVVDLGDTETGWSAAHTRRSARVIFHPRGTGAWAWSERHPYTLSRSLALLGRTADSERVWDVVHAARQARKDLGKGPRLTLAGRGPAGVIAAYAALLEPGVDRVVVSNPPQSHRDGPHFLNVLQVCDIADALGMLAPRSLLLVDPSAELRDRVEKIYAAAGAPQQLTVRDTRKKE